VVREAVGDAWGPGVTVAVAGLSNAYSSYVVRARQSDYRAEESNKLNGKVKVERQLVRLPWAADGCPWVGK
jgi:hypothetical protein